LEISKTIEGIFLYQRKHTLDLLQERKMDKSIPLRVPLTPNLKLFVEHGNPLKDPNLFQRLVGKLICLSLTQPDISFAAQV